MTHSIFHEAKAEGPLYALFLNCTLKKSPEVSNTEALCNLLVERLKAHEPDIETEIVRVADYNVLPGISNDEGDGDDWPEILEKIKRCNIFIPAMAIWMGVRSSIAQRVIERLDGTTKTVMCEKTGQFPLYGSVCGCVVTGNEDGVKHCSMNILYSLQHLGYVIPPQADAGWIGEAGPGASYLDPGSGGPENDFTNRNTTFMTWNVMHLARMITDAGGIPAHGNQRSKWEAGCRPDHAVPEFR